MPRGGKYKEYREKPSRGCLAEANQQNGVFMLRVQIKEQETEFQGTSPTNFVVVA